MSLLGVRRFWVPDTIARRSVELMQRAAAGGAEIFIVWTGVPEGETLTFRRLLVPRQTPLRTRHGLLVHVDGQALFELNRDCHSNGDVVAGQIHAHPTDAYHSEADDELAIVRLPGGISVVAPDFARGGIADADRWACFRLDAQSRWTPLPQTVEVALA